jgi:hypothetical protein
LRRRLHLTLNLGTAKEPGLTVPPTLLARANDLVSSKPKSSLGVGRNRAEDGDRTQKRRFHARVGSTSRRSASKKPEQVEQVLSFNGISLFRVVPLRATNIRGSSGELANSEIPLVFGFGIDQVRASFTAKLHAV